MIQISDHATASRRASERRAIRNASWSLEEYRALADRYADAVLAFQIAVAIEDFAALREAALTLHEVCHQTSGLNLGIKHAIANAEQEYRR